MRKDYIIKDARRILAEQIRDNGRNTMNENPITNATGLSAVIPKDNDGYCTVYKLDCADGLGLMTVYQVYPGIQLIYNDFEATSCYWDGNIGKNVLEINRCREGREGSVLQSGSCLYLGEGDTAKKPDHQAHVLVDANRAFLQPSMILAESVQTISKGRLIRPMGRLSIPELIRLNYALLYQLDLNEWVWRKEDYERYLRYHR